MKMRTRKQNGLQAEKMKPNAVNNCTISVQSFFLKVGPGAVLSPAPSPV